MIAVLIDTNSYSPIVRQSGFLNPGNPKMYRPSANTENSRRTREKPLVPRVLHGTRVIKTRSILIILQGKLPTSF